MKATCTKTRQVFLVIVFSLGAFAADEAFGTPPGMPFGWKAPSWGHSTPPQRNWKRHMEVKYGSYPPVVYYQDGNSGIYWKYNDARGIWDEYCTDYNYEGKKWSGFLCTAARGGKRVTTVLWKEWGGWDKQDKDCYRLGGRTYDENNKPGGEFVISMWGCF
jgi:hypothetical protein